MWEYGYVSKLDSKLVKEKVTFFTEKYIKPCKIMSKQAYPSDDECF